MSFEGRFLASVYLRGGSRNLSQPTPVQAPLQILSPILQEAFQTQQLTATSWLWGPPQWKTLCLVHARLTVCVLAVLPLHRLPGTAHTPGRSVFIQDSGYTRARLRWRQPKAGLLFPFFHISGPMEIQCSMLQWRHLPLTVAKQCSWVPTYSLLQHGFSVSQEEIFQLSTLSFFPVSC